MRSLAATHGGAADGAACRDAHAAPAGHGARLARLAVRVAAALIRAGLAGIDDGAAARLRVVRGAQLAAAAVRVGLAARGHAASDGIATHADLPLAAVLIGATARLALASTHGWRVAVTQRIRGAVGVRATAASTCRRAAVRGPRHAARALHDAGAVSEARLAALVAGVLAGDERGRVGAGVALAAAVALRGAAAWESEGEQERGAHRGQMGSEAHPPTLSDVSSGR